MVKELKTESWKNIFILTADLLMEVVIILFRAKGKEDKKQTTFLCLCSCCALTIIKLND